jgi:hypothetical protein
MIFVRKCWYVAGWSHDIAADSLVSRTMLSESLYRKANGSGQLRADQRQPLRSDPSQLCPRKDPRPEQHELGESRAKATPIERGLRIARWVEAEQRPLSQPAERRFA